MKKKIRTTNVHAAKAAPSSSKRTSIPTVVWDFLGLKVGDKLTWLLDVDKNGNKQAVMQKYQEKS